MLLVLPSCVVPLCSCGQVLFLTAKAGLRSCHVHAQAWNDGRMWTMRHAERSASTTPNGKATCKCAAHVAATKTWPPQTPEKRALLAMWPLSAAPQQPGSPAVLQATAVLCASGLGFHHLLLSCMASRFCATRVENGNDHGCRWACAWACATEPSVFSVFGRLLISAGRAHEPHSISVLPDRTRSNCMAAYFSWRRPHLMLDAAATCLHKQGVTWRMCCIEELQITRSNPSRSEAYSSHSTTLAASWPPLPIQAASNAACRKHTAVSPHLVFVAVPRTQVHPELLAHRPHNPWLQHGANTSTRQLHLSEFNQRSQRRSISLRLDPACRQHLTHTSNTSC